MADEAVISSDSGGDTSGSGVQIERGSTSSASDIASLSVPGAAVAVDKKDGLGSSLKLPSVSVGGKETQETANTKNSTGTETSGVRGALDFAKSLGSLANTDKKTETNEGSKAGESKLSGARGFASNLGNTVKSGISSTKVDTGESSFSGASEVTKNAGEAAGGGTSLFSGAKSFVDDLGASFTSTDPQTSGAGERSKFSGGSEVVKSMGDIATSSGALAGGSSIFEGAKGFVESLGSTLGGLGSEVAEGFASAASALATEIGESIISGIDLSYDDDFYADDVAYGVGLAARESQDESVSLAREEEEKKYSVYRNPETESPPDSLADLQARDNKRYFASLDGSNPVEQEEIAIRESFGV